MGYRHHPSTLHTCPFQGLQPNQFASFCGGLMTIHVGSSLCRRGTSAMICHTTSQVSSSHLSLIFLFPFQALPSLVPGCQVSNSLCLFFCHSNVSVGMLPWWIGPVPPTGCSSIYHSQKLHSHPHSWWRPLLWGPHCCQQ